MQKVKTVYFSKLLQRESSYSKLFNTLSSILEKHKYPVKTLNKTKDIWIRDFMPILFENNAIQYQYKPDYLIKDDKDTAYITDPNLPIEEIGISTYKTELIMDGGNIVTQNGIVIMTDKVFTENANLTVEDFKTHFPHIKKLVLIPRDPDSEEIYGHADGMVRFVSDTHILVNSQYPKTFKQKLHAVLKENGFKVTELQVKENTKYAWGYINFLHLDSLIIQPSIDKSNDTYVKEQLEILYPNVTVELCDAKALVKDGGVFNCVSWEL